MRGLLPVSFALFVFSISAVATNLQQQPKPEPQPTPTEAPHTAPADRLVAAKNLFLKKTTGSEIPYEVINTDFEGWGRYVLVDNPDKADLIMEISAPVDNSGTRISTKVNRETGQQDNGYSSSKEFSSDPIKITVYDAKSKRPLWSASDKPKFAMKQKARENNLVESAERLFSKFHDRVEPKKLP
ncbi:MAG TPA: hypothetical protein VHA33_01385 [Candidatus Angelobacter sp.]|jgi:hypothetical protein|nr:hypothetical protein [Candidatus Angelobacter sp.]